MKLKSPRLEIEFFAHADINQHYLAWLNDSNYMAYSEQRLIAHNLISSQEYLSGFDFVNNFLMSIRCGSQLIGTATIYIEQDFSSSFANMGLLIGNEYANQGFGLEAWTVLKNHFGASYSPITILAGTRIENIGMNLICQKSGMKKLNPDQSSKYVDLNFNSFNYYTQDY
jgi:RimJ/RimL family protein N-acetyltransferase